MTLPSTSDFTNTRLSLLKAWLQGHAARYALELDSLVPASSDASFRRYFRLSGKAPQGNGATTLIAVDAPPPEKCREFAQIAQLLEAAGVHVPRVLEVARAALGRGPGYVAPSAVGRGEAYSQGPTFLRGGNIMAIALDPSRPSAPWWKEPTKDQWFAWIAAWLGWMRDAFAGWTCRLPVSRGLATTTLAGIRTGWLSSAKLGDDGRYRLQMPM